MGAVSTQQWPLMQTKLCGTKSTTQQPTSYRSNILFRSQGCRNKQNKNECGVHGKNSTRYGAQSCAWITCSLNGMLIAALTLFWTSRHYRNLGIVELSKKSETLSMKMKGKMWIWKSTPFHVIIAACACHYQVSVWMKINEWLYAEQNKLEQIKQGWKCNWHSYFNISSK